MDITSSLDTNQAGMTNTVTISAVSYTPTNEVDHLIDTTNIPPSDTDSSATNNTTNTLPCEETTISTGIVNQAASDDTSSAPLSDIANMTNEADFHCVQCDRRFRTKGVFSNHVKSHEKGMSDTVANSAASDTLTNKIDPLSDTSSTLPSDTNSSPTNNTTSTLPCEEATIPTGIANQGASADTDNAPLNDINNMTNQEDQRFHWDAPTTKILKDHFIEWINMPFGCSLPGKTAVEQWILKNKIIAPYNKVRTKIVNMKRLQQEKTRQQLQKIGLP